MVSIIKVTFSSICLQVRAQKPSSFYHVIAAPIDDLDELLGLIPLTAKEC